MPYTIKQLNNQGDLEIMPHSSQPLIYHDTCMTWHLVDRSPDDRKSFMDTFTNSNGTLCLTAHTLNEILNRSKGAWYSNFQEYCEQIGDRFVFLLFNPFRVIEREPRYSGHELDCVVDVPLIKDAFLSFYLKDRSTPNLRCIFDYYYDHSKKRISLMASYQALLKELCRSAMSVRSQYHSDNDKRRSAAKALRETLNDEHYTRYFTRFVLNDIAKNAQWKMDSNEAADFFHAIIPISWCDFVVLDKGWKELAVKAFNGKPHSTRVFKIGEVTSYLETLKRDGPLYNRAHITKKWAHALGQQKVNPFQKG